MNLLDLFRRQRQTPAQTAKERLQILLAHERVDTAGPDYLPLMQKEILEVVKKYLPVQFDREKVEVKLERGFDVSTLEVNIELPGATALSTRQPPRGASPAMAG